MEPFFSKDFNDGSDDCEMYKSTSDEVCVQDCVWLKAPVFLTSVSEVEHKPQKYVLIL